MNGDIIVNLVTIGIILLAFIISTVLSIWFYKKHGSKWKSLLLSFTINILILGISSALLYKIDVQKYHKEAELGIIGMLLFIPLLTLVTFYILEIFRYKSNRSNI